MDKLGAGGTPGWCSPLGRGERAQVYLLPLQEEDGQDKRGLDLSGAEEGGEGPQQTSVALDRGRELQLSRL